MPGGGPAPRRGLPIDWICVADLAPDCLETWRTNHAREHPDSVLALVDLGTEEGRSQFVDACVGHRIDLIVGGIPCEAVSQARGKNYATTEDFDRLHALVDGLFSVIAYKGPRWWCLEDVITIEH